ncbi:MAG: deoxyribose-phosphate aldolase [Treponema sp.]|nr:deoxyribose-phosphate aldolase [Treponema sp.]MCL2237842.1 deoxyribose-phosphate aldolase [Treponema sp.]
MTNEDIFSRIDHTLLKMTASREEIKTLCDEAVIFKTASVCVPPCYVKQISNDYCNQDCYNQDCCDNLNICTVIGFPLGYSITAAKVLEAQRAILSGANEIDMVINVCDVKNANFDYIMEEIKLVKKACDDKILKVIIETCYLTDEEKIRLCIIVTEAGADFIKTSTGFGTAGAVLSDIELFKKNIGKNVKIKAAGGVKTREDIVSFINAGADRIGTSSGVKILTGENAGSY